MIIRSHARQHATPLKERLLGVKALKKRASKQKKSALRPLTVAIYASMFVGVVAIIAAGYTPSRTTVANIAPVEGATAQEQTSVNEVVATTIAADIAEAAQLPVATNVANLSVSLVAKNEVVLSSAAESVDKQAIVQPTSSRRSLITYTTQAGDTVEALAAEYAVSSETIRWANNLTSDALDAEKSLVIPPVDGVVYTVKDGDTIEKIAEKYNARTERIVAFNDLELGGLSKDARIIIPGGQLPETERPGYVAPRPTVSRNQISSGAGGSRGNFMAGTVGNKYAYGYCTWYVYERRAAMGRPVGSFWGNANTWAAAARGQGFTVSNVPVAGAVFQTSYGGGGYGHVGIIESVDHAAGTVTYSDMNGGAGWNRIGGGTVSIGQAQSQWVFIY